MRRTRRTVVLVALSVLGASLTAATVTQEPAGATVPPGFVDEVVLSGLDLPTDIEFSADGRIFVAEKRGMVQVLTGEDKRTREISLAERGHRLLEEAVPLWEEAQGITVESLGQGRWRNLIAELSAAVEMLQAR